MVNYIRHVRSSMEVGFNFDVFYDYKCLLGKADVMSHFYIEKFKIRPNKACVELACWPRVKTTKQINETNENAK